MSEYDFTPAPWRVGRDNVILSGQRPDIAWPARANSEGDARRIVQCVNAHDDLVAALAGMVYEATHLSPQEDDGSHIAKISAAVLSTARAALAKARGER